MLAYLRHHFPAGHNMARQDIQRLVGRLGACSALSGSSKHLVLVPMDITQPFSYSNTCVCECGWVGEEGERVSPSVDAYASTVNAHESTWNKVDIGASIGRIRTGRRPDVDCWRPSVDSWHWSVDHRPVVQSSVPLLYDLNSSALFCNFQNTSSLQSLIHSFHMFISYMWKFSFVIAMLVA